MQRDLVTKLNCGDAWIAGDGTNPGASLEKHQDFAARSRYAE
jgi:hypothetical protein